MNSRERILSAISHRQPDRVLRWRGFSESVPCMLWHQLQIGASMYCDAGADLAKRNPCLIFTTEGTEFITESHCFKLRVFSV